MSSVSVQDDSVTERRRRAVRVGLVTSDKGDKTITVRFEYIVQHPKYRKYYRRSTKLRSHDERNEAKIGDVVEVVSCRPISKTKCWRLSRVVRPVDSKTK